MTKTDDPFAKTELGQPTSAAFVRPGSGPSGTAPMDAGPTDLAPPPSDALPSDALPPALPPLPLPPIAGAPGAIPSHTVLGAPSPEAIAAWGQDKGFTELGLLGPGRTQLGELGPGFTELGPAAAGPAPAATEFGKPVAAMTELGRPGAGFTELGGNRPGFTIPGGVPPPDAFAPNDPRPHGFTQLSHTDFGAAQAWEAAAAEAERELLRAKSLHHEGVAAGKAGHFAHADAMLRESLDLRRRYRPPGDILIAHGCVSLGTLYYFGRRPDLAEPLYREAWMLHRAGLGDLHPETATRAVELARALVMLVRVPEAYGLLRGAHEVYSRSFGPVHPATLEVMDMMRHLYG